MRLYFILLQYHSTRFGCRPHPSSGAHETVVTATGTSHMVVQLRLTLHAPNSSVKMQNKFPPNNHINIITFLKFILHYISKMWPVPSDYGFCLY